MPGQDHTRDGFASETWHDSLFPPWPLPKDIHPDLLKLALVFRRLHCPPKWQEQAQDLNLLGCSLYMNMDSFLPH